MAGETTKVDVTSDKPAQGQGARPEAWNPFSNLRTEIERLFDEFDGGGWRGPLSGRFSDFAPLRTPWTFAPAMDLVEHDGDYQIRAELPGMDAKSLESKVSDGMIVLKGQKSEEREDEDVHVSERRFGSFRRSLRLPPGIDATKIAARFENGVLTVTLPKSPDARSKERTIKVSEA